VHGRPTPPRPGRHPRSWRRPPPLGTAGAARAAQEPAGDRQADARDLGEAATGLGDDHSDLLGDGPNKVVGVADLGDDVAGELLAGDLAGPDRPNAGQQPRGGCSGHVRVGTAWQQVAQQRVQLADQTRPMCDEVVAALIEQPEHGRRGFGQDRSRVPVQRTGTGGRAGSMTPFFRRPPRDSSRTRAIAVDGTSVTVSRGLSATAPDAAPDPGRSPPPSVARRTMLTSAATADSRPSTHRCAICNVATTARVAASRALAVCVRLCGSTPTMITVLLSSVGSGTAERQAGLQVPVDDQSSVESDHGGGTGRLDKPPAEPTRRRQTIHESGPPAPPRDGRSTSPPPRASYKSRRFRSLARTLPDTAGNTTRKCDRG
jgi:hypothetical protein